MSKFKAVLALKVLKQKSNKIVIIKSKALALTALIVDLDKLNLHSTRNRKHQVYDDASCFYLKFSETNKQFSFFIEKYKKS